MNQNYPSGRVHICWIFHSNSRNVVCYPHLGTSILCGLRPSQLLHQHGAQVLWRRHKHMLCKCTWGI